MRKHAACIPCSTQGVITYSCEYPTLFRQRRPGISHYRVIVPADIYMQFYTGKERYTAVHQ